MCRNIKPLYHFDPPASDEEIHAAALQFVRKVSGFNKPSQANQGAFDRAVEEVAKTIVSAGQHYFAASTTTTAHNREVEAAKAIIRSERRFGPRSANGAPFNPTI